MPDTDIDKANADYQAARSAWSQANIAWRAAQDAYTQAEQTYAQGVAEATARFALAAVNGDGDAYQVWETTLARLGEERQRALAAHATAKAAYTEALQAIHAAVQAWVEAMNAAGGTRGMLEMREHIVPGQTLPLFVPAHVGGDTDFYGHGPDVEVSVELSIKAKNQLWARLSMEARETKADWTEVRGAVNRMIYQHDRPIESIVSGTRSTLRRRLSGHGPHVIEPTSDSDPVARYTLIGDTDGHEAGTKTGVSVILRPVTLICAA
jgi:hypothetical protein